MANRIEVVTMDRSYNTNDWNERRIFGPTCDSVDELPSTLKVPDHLKEGDYIIFHGLGAYSTSTQTTFNGYGMSKVVNVHSLDSE